MHQRGIAVECEDDGLVLGEQCVVIGIGQAVRMLGVRFQLHQVYNVHHADLQFRQCVTQDGDSGQRFQRGSKQKIRIGIFKEPVRIFCILWVKAS